LEALESKTEIQTEVIAFGTGVVTAALTKQKQEKKK